MFQLFAVVPSLSSSQRQKFKNQFVGSLTVSPQDRRAEEKPGLAMVQVKPGLSKRISEGACICKGLSCGKFSKEKEGRSRGEGGEKRGKNTGRGERDGVPNLYAQLIHVRGD